MSMWYHGTGSDAANIAKIGLHASYYGTNYPQGSGWPLHTVARDRHQANLPGRDTVIVFHIADDEAGEYLTCMDGSSCCNGYMSGLLLPLPTYMIHAMSILSGSGCHCSLTT